MTTDRPRTETGPQSFSWWGLLPDQLCVAVVFFLVTPGIYGAHLVTSGRFALGSFVLAGWVLLYGLLLRFAHRRRWARLALTIPATIVLVGLGGWIFR